MLLGFQAFMCYLCSDFDVLVFVCYLRCMKRKEIIPLLETEEDGAGGALGGQGRGRNVML